MTSPTGTRYLVDSDRGGPAPGAAQLQVEWVGGGEVPSVSMDNDLDIPGDTLMTAPVSFPVYTLSKGDGHGKDGHVKARGAYCALIWPTVLSSGRPVAGPGVDQHALGTVARPDGTRQVTYHGKPLYLFLKDAYIPGVTGAQGINGAGAVTPWGMFNTIPLS